MPEPVQRFKHLRVKIDCQEDAADVVLKCSAALLANGVTGEELDQFREECINADDPMDVAREWVDPY